MQCALPGNQPASIDLIDIKGRILWGTGFGAKTQYSIINKALTTCLCGTLHTETTLMKRKSSFRTKLIPRYKNTTSG